MSWTIMKTGTPEEVVKQLNEESEQLSGQSKEEYDSALPHLIGLVEQNIDGYIQITASGYGYKEDGEYKDRTCSVQLMSC